MCRVSISFSGKAEGCKRRERRSLALGMKMGLGRCRYFLIRGEKIVKSVSIFDQQ